MPDVSEAYYLLWHFFWLLQEWHLEGRKHLLKGRCRSDVPTYLKCTGLPLSRRFMRYKANFSHTPTSSNMLICSKSYLLSFFFFLDSAFNIYFWKRERRRLIINFKCKSGGHKHASDIFELRDLASLRNLAVCFILSDKLHFSDVFGI